MAQKLEEIVTYTIQVGSDVPVRVNDCGLPSKLDDATDDYDIAALIGVEVGGSDARCGLGLHGEQVARDGGTGWDLEVPKVPGLATRPS